MYPPCLQVPHSVGTTMAETNPCRRASLRTSKSISRNSKPHVSCSIHRAQPQPVQLSTARAVGTPCLPCTHATKSRGDACCRSWLRLGQVCASDLAPNSSFATCHWQQNRGLGKPYCCSQTKPLGLAARGFRRRRTRHRRSSAKQEYVGGK